MEKNDTYIALSIIYDLTIEARGINCDEKAEQQALMRLIHTTSGEIGKSLRSASQLLAMYAKMCEKDYRSLRIYPELRKILLKHQAILEN